MKCQINQTSYLIHVLSEFSRRKVKSLTILFCLPERVDITKSSVPEQPGTCWFWLWKSLWVVMTQKKVCTHLVRIKPLEEGRGLPLCSLTFLWALLFRDSLPLSTWGWKKSEQGGFLDGWAFYRYPVALCHSDKWVTLSRPSGLGKCFHHDSVPLSLQFFIHFYVAPSCEEFKNWVKL